MLSKNICALRANAVMQLIILTLFLAVIELFYTLLKIFI